MFAASVTVTKAPEAKTLVDSALLDKMEHSESIFSESRSSQRTLTRVPKVTTESYPL